MDDVNELQRVYEVLSYKSGTCRDLGRNPAGVGIDSVYARTDNNQIIAKKNIKVNVVDGEMKFCGILPRKESATMRVTVTIGFKPE